MRIYDIGLTKLGVVGIFKNKLRRRIYRGIGGKKFKKI